MPSKRLISFVTRGTVAIILILVANGIVTLLVQTKPELAIESKEQSLPAVVVMLAKPVPVRRTTIGFGTADAVQHADVPAEISSTVVLVPPAIREGRMVRKGELLAELDDVDFVQQVIRAEQALASTISDQALLLVERYAADKRAILALEDQALSEAELARVQDAFDRGVAKQREVDAAKQKVIAVSSAAINATEIAQRFPAKEEQASSAVISNEASLQLARENLRRCKIRSPIDGVIQEIDIRVGEHVQSGRRIARVVNSGTIQIPLRLPSYARAHVMVGDEVVLRSAGFGVRQWKARLTRIAPEDDTQTRTIVVYVDIDQDQSRPDRLSPGLFVRGEVIQSQHTKPRWVVPRRSIRDGRVLIVREGTMSSVPVSIDFSVIGELETFGLPDRDWAVLETPLLDGDLVVVDPGGTLRDGMEVRPILATEVSLE